MNDYYRKDGQDWIDKAPAAILDYSRDLTEWLADVGDDVALLTVIAQGVTVNSQAVSGGLLVAWISGGAVGVDAWVTFRWTTVAGRADERTIRLNIVAR